MNATGPARTVERYSLVLTVACLVIVVDQATKAAVIATLSGGSTVDLLGGVVQLEYTRNTGAAFSILKSGGWVFAAIATAVSVGILVYLRKYEGRSPVALVALGCILGGAVGNLVDRIRLGYVVDFIDLRWWPVFNLADSAIVLGVAVLVLRSLVTSAGSDRHA